MRMFPVRGYRQRKRETETRRQGQQEVLFMFDVGMGRQVVMGLLGGYKEWAVSTQNITQSMLVGEHRERKGFSRRLPQPHAGDRTCGLGGYYPRYQQ